MVARIDLCYFSQEENELLRISSGDMSQVFYLELAKRCGGNWEEIGLYLGVGFDFLEQLRKDFPPGVEGNIVSFALRLFVRWRKSGGKTLKDLHDALVGAGEGTLASFVLENAKKYKAQNVVSVCR